jgi:hypothetical protein
MVLIAYPGIGDIVRLDFYDSCSNENLVMPEEIIAMRGMLLMRWYRAL